MSDTKVLKMCHWVKNVLVRLTLQKFEKVQEPAYKISVFNPLNRNI